MKSVNMQELAQALETGTILVDVREDFEFAAGHVPSAKNIPLSQLEARAGEIADGTYIICQSGARSMRACQFLEMNGLDVTNVLGGTMAWTAGLER
jgi:rhodanese-related sulfurtransferase